MTSRTYNCLKRANIHTLLDLLSKTEEDLLRIDSFRMEDRKHIWDTLEKHLPIDLLKNKLSYQLYHAPLKKTMLKLLYVLGAGVSVMPLSLYRRLELNKLTPTKISLQMADKSTAIPVGICEDVPVVVANVTILTDFVIIDIPEDDSMSIILGRPFLNTAGAVIDCTKGNVTFHVNGNEHTVHFPRKQPQVHSINSIGMPSIIFGGFEFPLPTVKKKYDILIIGDVHIPVEVT